MSHLNTPVTDVIPEATPKPLAAVIDKLSKTAPQSRIGALMGAYGGIAGEPMPGSISTRGRVKVNYVPVSELKTIVGVGDKIATRMHVMRLSEGNLTENRLKKEFGGKMTVAIIDQMDFEMNDMLRDIGEVKKIPAQVKLEERFDERNHDDTEVKKHRVVNRQDGEGETRPSRKSKASKSKKYVKDSEYRSPTRMVKKRKRKGYRSKAPVSQSDTESDSSDSEVDITEDSDSESDSDGEYYTKSMALKKMPNGFDKNLRFSGSTDNKGDDFDSFKLKFKSYAKAFQWTEEERRFCLCWSLQGQAAKYHTVISSGKGTLTYKELMKKLEKRFGGEELVETAQARFNIACQEPRETLEMWADRVQVLALKAFKKLPESYATSQAVTRFCLGLEDKEASKDACLKRFKTMDEAKDYLHYFFHVSGASSKPKSRRNTARDQDESLNVYEASVTKDDLQRELRQLRSYFDQQLTINKEGTGTRGKGTGYRDYRPRDIESRNNQSRNGRTGYFGGRGDSNRGKAWGNNRGRGGYQQRFDGPQQGNRLDFNQAAAPNGCYFCGDPSHIRSDCEAWWATQQCFCCKEFGHRQNNCPKRQQMEGNLNLQGSGVGAKLDSTKSRGPRQ